MKVERTQEEFNALIDDMVKSWSHAREGLYHIPRPSKDGVCSVYELTTDGLRARAIALVYHCLGKSMTKVKDNG